MNRLTLLLATMLGIATVIGGAAAASATGDDDDKPANAAQAGSQLSLTVDQRRAIGVELAHPIAAHLAAHIEAAGVVLDSADLVSEAAELDAAVAVEAAAASEFARLQKLAGDNGGVAPKAVEAAAAEEAQASAKLQMAKVVFSEHWSPLNKLPPARRRSLIVAVAQGDARLVRADWPGHHSFGALPDRASIDIDGLRASGEVLGALRAPSPTMSAGVLLLLAKAPPGLSSGAHVPAQLELKPRAGFLLPRAAILLDDSGAYVFKQLRPEPKADLRYVRVKIKLLLPQDNGWLVSGVDDDDDIVVAGSGALWSLEGLRGRVVEADDDDD